MKTKKSQKQMERKGYECPCEWCQAHKLYRSTNNPFYIIALVVGDSIDVWKHMSESIRKKDFSNLPLYRDSLDHLDLALEEVERFKCKSSTFKDVLTEERMHAKHLLKKVYGIIDLFEQLEKEETEGK